LNLKNFFERINNSEKFSFEIIISEISNGNWHKDYAFEAASTVNF
jgi:hypothetical protein